MKTHIVNLSNQTEHLPLLEGYHRLRHKLFIEDVAWEGPQSLNGYEYDYWDMPVGRATHFITTADNGEVAAFIRAVRTSDTTMFEMFFEDHLYMPLEKSPHIIEVHRYGVDRSLPKIDQKIAILSLMATLTYWAADNDIHTSVMFGYADLLFKSASLQRGAQIGPAVKLEDGIEYVAMSAPLSRKIALEKFAQLDDVMAHKKSVAA